MIQTQENSEKTHFWPKLGFLYSTFFKKNLTSSVTRYHGELLSSTKSEKNNDPILRKLSDGRKDGRTKGQTAKSDFIGRCPTNVERPATNL